MRPEDREELLAEQRGEREQQEQAAEEQAQETRRLELRQEVEDLKREIAREDERALAVAEASTLGEEEVVDEEKEGERLERQRLEDKAALEAFKKVPERLGGLLANNVELYRKALDPRVLLEAAEVGLSEAELAAMRERMDDWAKAVEEKREGESLLERKRRLQELRERLFHRAPPVGCGCKGTGFLLYEGQTVLRRDGVPVPDMDVIRICRCNKGAGKARFYETMGKSKLMRGRGGRGPTSDDAVPI